MAGKKGVSVAMLTLSIFMVGMLASLVLAGYEVKQTESSRTLTGLAVKEKDIRADESLDNQVVHEGGTSIASEQMAPTKDLTQEQMDFFE
ncbi:hypothetical protein JW868_01375 [Candidatus Woesearchaeota archaeon]|nr:hypothetical protein [Candidatus Woesearchaeota archaeon]